MAHFNGKINNYFAHCADLSDLPNVASAEAGTESDF